MLNPLPSLSEWKHYISKLSGDEAGAEEESPRARNCPDAELVLYDLTISKQKTQSKLKFI